MLPQLTHIYHTPTTAFLAVRSCRVSKSYKEK
jgi:hypothetical protein